MIRWYPACFSNGPATTGFYTYWPTLSLHAALPFLAHRPDRPGLHRRRALGGRHPAGDLADLAGDVLLGRVPPQPQPRQGGRGARAHPAAARSEERRVGKECVSTCRSL